ncbi:MAG TPA: hypothetical protein VFC32_10630, partial [Pseudolabrys sp.]|nr:hypothetical protein [Pseudolabrys sp.]
YLRWHTSRIISKHRIKVLKLPRGGLSFCDLGSRHQIWLAVVSLIGRLGHRYVQSSKMVHAALLLLMLEAVTTNLVSTISLKRSTQHLQLSTSCRPITPSNGT